MDDARGGLKRYGEHSCQHGMLVVMVLERKSKSHRHDRDRYGVQVKAESLSCCGQSRLQ
jgi:hypothetical protein